MRKTPAWDLTQYQPENINQTESYYQGAFDLKFSHGKLTAAL